VACLATRFEKGNSSGSGEAFTLFFGYLSLLFQIAFVTRDDNGRIFITIFHLTVNSN